MEYGFCCPQARWRGSVSDQKDDSPAGPEVPTESLENTDAFERADGEQFTVNVTPEGQPSDNDDYKIPSPDFDTDDSFSVWILVPETSKAGKRSILLSHCVVEN